MGGERFEQRGETVVAAGLTGEELGLVEAEHVADADHAAGARGSDGFASGGAERKTVTEGARGERFEQGEGEGEAGGAEEEAAVHLGGWRLHGGIYELRFTDAGIWGATRDREIFDVVIQIRGEGGRREAGWFLTTKHTNDTKGN